MSRHVSDQLSAYIDGALGVRDVERVKVHLDACPACLQEYRGVQEVQRLLRALPDPAPRAGFLDRMHWQLQQEAARHPRPSPVSGALGVFACGTTAVGPPGWPQPGAADTALAWLRSGTQAPQRISYEGTKSITVWGGQVHASQVRVFHAAPDHTRLEYLPAGAQPRRIVIIQGRTEMEYVPA